MQNATFYSALFDVPVSKFASLPLSILPPKTDVDAPKLDDTKCRCLFVGSFVPLQGIQILVDAATILKDNDSISFLIIGTGQDAHILQEAIQEKGLKNIHWVDKFVDHNEMSKAIHSSDLGLGVFGKNKKTQRVLPYKVYNYLAHGMPVATAKTPAIDAIYNTDQLSYQLLSTPGNGQSLSEKIVWFSQNRDQWITLREEAKIIFDTNLSYDRSKTRLIQILENSNHCQFTN
jgi:glycosyltransferase involved in cell wall biosynthesis